MSRITTYPKITEISPEDLLVISDVSTPYTSTRTVTVQDLVGGSTAPLALTTFGTSGPATLINNVLNVPIYSSGTMSSWTAGAGGEGGFEVSDGELVSFIGGTKLSSSAISGTSSITFDHNPTTRADTTSAVSPAAGATFTVIDSITQDATGHPTEVNVKTVTLPAGGGGGTTYDLASVQNGDNVDITLTPATGTVDTVQLTAGSGITLTDDGSNNITIDAAAGGSGLWTATGNDIYNNNSNAVVIGKTTTATDATAALEVSGRISQVDLGNGTFFGYRAGSSDDLSQNNNTAVGYLALNNSTSGYDNVAVGAFVLSGLSTGARNVGIGESALRLNNGNDNIAIGDRALDSTTAGFRDIAIGSNALSTHNGGGSNTAIGFNALEASTTGGNNVSIGNNSSELMAITQRNTAVGSGAFSKNTSGDDNIAIGFNAGDGSSAPFNETGDRNVYIGSLSQGAVQGGSRNNTNEIVIGYNAIGHGSNTATIGNFNVNRNYFNGTLVSPSQYTLAGLPAGEFGMRAIITDSAANPVFGAIASGGSNTIIPVFYNGTNWIYG